MKRYTHLIWDFNGTLLDDVLPDFNAANRLLERHGLPKLASVEIYREAFRFPVMDYYRRLGFDFSVTPYAELADEWWDDYGKRPEKATLYPEVPRILRKMRERGVPQIVLSATERTVLIGQLRELGISDAFSEILGADDLHAHGKAALARRWREANPNAVPLMIGDTDHDAETAKEMGADVILLTCGHQCRATLERAEPLMICEKPGQVPLDKLFPADCFAPRGE